jgi:thiamine-phosphate pyrophosphorylase
VNPLPLADRRRPLTCLVTDRRRWLLDAVDPALPQLMARRVGIAARAGIDVVQVREPDLPAKDQVAISAACVEIVRRTDTLIVVNERADVALAAGAHGVHLRGSSLPAARIRRLVPPGFIVGRSVHSASEVLAGVGEGVDYLIAGTVFPSRSKPAEHRLLEPAGLARVVSAATVPVLAIGGVSAQNVSLVALAGAAGVAAIDMFTDALGAEDSMKKLLESLRAAFE